MGLLDDAIREHLELKRQHGADPNEVERQEREALGAPQRAEFAPATDEAEAAAVGDAPVEPADDAPVEPVEEAPVEPLEEAEPATEIAEPEDAWPEDEPNEVPSEESLEREPAADDVLEETPEFLQETPEHERLWFEQRPPRDFDWDK